MNLISHPRGEKSEHLQDLAPRAAVNRSVIPHTGESYHCTLLEAGREVMENELSVILPFRSLSLCFSSETLGKFSITQLVFDNNRGLLRYTDPFWFAVLTV